MQPAPSAPGAPAPPPVEAGASDRAGAARLLELVAARVGSKLDPDVAWQAVSTLPATLLESDDVLGSLETAAPRAGLRAARIPVSSIELLDCAADPGRAMLVPLANGGAVTWVVPKERRGQRVRVHWISPAGESARTLDRRDIEQLLGDSDGTITALAFEPRFPLDSLIRQADSLAHPAWRAWARVGRFAALEARDLRLVVIYAIAIGVLSLLTPVAVQALVSSIAFTTAWQPLVVLALALLGGLAFSAVLRGLRVYIVEMLERRAFVRVAADYARRLPEIEDGARRKYSLPDATLHFFDALTLQKAGATLLLEALGLALQTITGMILLAFYHPYLLAFDVVLAIFLFAIIFTWLKPATESAVLESKAKYRVAGWLQEVATAAGSFASQSGVRHATARADSLIRGYLIARSRHFTYVLRLVVGGLALQVLAPVTLLALGGILVMRRELTLGQLVAAELVVAAIGVGFGKLGRHLEKTFDCVAGIDKISKLVELPHRTATGEPVEPDPAPTVHLAGSPCGNFEVPGGTSAELLGDVPSVRRVFDALHGGDPDGFEQIEIGHQDVRWADRDQLRDVVWRLDTPRFFHGTVLDNLRLGPRAVDVPAARTALELVRLDPRSLESGLDTVLGRDGSPLTPGEQKRLNLARAMLHKPSVLILDGALDDLELNDSERERALDAIVGHGTPWTALVRTNDPAVAHRCGMRIYITEGDG